MLALPPAGLLGWESLGTQGPSQLPAPLVSAICPGELSLPGWVTWESLGALVSDQRT